MSTTTSPAARTYGNWQAPRSVGVGPLGLLATAVLMGGLILGILLAATAGLVPALLLGFVVVVLVGLLTVHDRHGRSVLQRATTRAAFSAARRRGSTAYHSGPLSVRPYGTHQLPGLLARSTLTEYDDEWGRPFALLHLPSVGHYTVVLATEPDGQALVDPDQVDDWVALWGQWLATLGDEPSLLGAAVTVETAPDTGARLRNEIETNLDADAPPLARQMFADVMATYPKGSDTIKAWVSLTFAARQHGRRRSTDEVAQDLAGRLPGFIRALGHTGAGNASPVSADELCEIVRVAYDPSAAALFDRARARHGRLEHLHWSDAGPSIARAEYDHYAHEAAASCTWQMSQAPRGHVHANVLHRLLAPHPEIARKRVTLTYQPMDAATAARVVEADVRGADFRVNSAERVNAKLLAAQQSAHVTATEEAQGAGLVNFGLLVTATVTDPARLERARAAVHDLAGTARLTLRPCYGTQDGSFAACLPLGVVLPRHLRVPAEIRRAL